MSNNNGWWAGGGAALGVLVGGRIPEAWPWWYEAAIVAALALVAYMVMKFVTASKVDRGNK